MWLALARYWGCNTAVISSNIADNDKMAQLLAHSLAQDEPVVNAKSLSEFSLDDLQPKSRRCPTSLTLRVTMEDTVGGQMLWHAWLSHWYPLHRSRSLVRALEM